MFISQITLAMAKGLINGEWFYEKLGWPRAKDTIMSVA